MSAAPHLLPELDRVDSSTKLVGIARLAAMGESIQDGHNVEYFTLPVRSLTNKCTARHILFDWTINPYRGCEFACKYCYARYTHEFMEMREGVDFERKIYVKQQSAWLLRRDLKKVKPGQEIAIGTATDPYQPAERRYGMTRSIMEELALHSGLSIGVVTKSQLVLRDIDVLRQIGERNSIAIHLTVTTMNVDLARKLEPRAPRPDIRMDAVRQLNEAGVTAAVICAPVLPGISDHPADLDKVIAAAARAKAKYVYPNPLFLKDCAWKMFMPFVEEHFPQLVASYTSRYKYNAYVDAGYRRRIGALFDRLCKKHGLPDRNARRESREAGAEKLEEQMRLF
jgi:DNA repair photolyase